MNKEWNDVVSGFDSYSPDVSAVRKTELIDQIITIHYYWITIELQCFIDNH